jgi:hypothetical protein
VTPFIFVDKCPPSFLLHPLCPWYLSFEKTPLQDHRLQLFALSYSLPPQRVALPQCRWIHEFLRVYQATLCHIPDYPILNINRRMNLKSHNVPRHGQNTRNVVDGWAQLIVSTESDFLQLSKFVIGLLNDHCVRKHEYTFTTVIQTLHTV